MAQLRRLGPRPGAIARPRLHDWLDSAAQPALTLVRYHQLFADVLTARLVDERGDLDLPGIP